MVNYANSTLRILLGWVQGTAQWLWKMIVSPDGSSLFTWIGRHWLVTVVVLCIIGAAIDFAVYLARWRSDVVWRSFFRRLAERREQRRYGDAMPQDWYEDDSVPDDVPAGEAYAPEQPDWTPAETMDDAAYAENSDAWTPDPVPQEAQPEVYAPAVEESTWLQPEPQPEDMEVSRTERRRRRTERYQQQGGVRGRLTKLLIADDEETDLRYRPVQPAGSKADAFNEPVYPPQWQNPDDRA